MKKTASVLGSLACLVALLLVGCGDSSGAKSVTGTITAQEPVSLPAHAVVRVQVHDVTGTGPSKVIGEQVITPPGPWPIAFEVKCQSANVAPWHSYVLLVTITTGQDELLFMNQQVYFVLTRLHRSSNIRVLVDRID